MSIIKSPNRGFTSTTTHPPEDGKRVMPPATKSGSSQVGAALKDSINKTIGTVGAYAVPPIIIGLIVTILLFICTWIVAQAISQLFGIHRQFLVVCLSFLIGAVLAGTARFLWGMSGVAVGIGSAIKNLILSAEAHNWDRQMVMGRLMLIGSVSALFVIITLFSLSMLGGAVFYITSQTTSNNIFAFNSDKMLETTGGTVNQEELHNRSISLLPNMAAGQALRNINNAGLASGTADIATQTASVNTPSPAGTTIYKVRRGDTLSKIAAKYNVSVNSLKSVNRISGNQINVGQKLTIPK